jgi:5-hydroxyisourate hydrolase-like protein (transthyretin family)
VALGRVACVVLFAIGLSAQQAASAPAAQGYRIVGVVVNALTGQPLPAVSVAIAPTTPQGSSREVSQDVVTGDDGRFTFAGLTRGKYSLMATARGFALQSFEQHDAYSSAIAVGPDLDSEHLVFRLQPDASIEGQVIDENNDPVQTATVHLYEKRIVDGQERTSSVNQVQTDDQGHFRLGHLASGTYYLAVSARPWYAQNDRSASQKPSNPDAQARAAQEAAALDVTYSLTFYPDSPDSAGASPIVLHPGERATADVLMHAVPALHLRIHTGGANSGPLFAIGRMTFPRVSQRIFEGYLDPVSNSPVSGTEPGVLQILGLAPGHYVIEMPASSAASDKVSSRGWYREIDLFGDADLNAGEAPSFVTVSGSVVFEGAGTVPRNPWIQLLNPTTGENFTASISGTGQFEFSGDGVRAGRYNVAFGSSGQGFFFSKLSATGARIVGRTLDIPAGSSVRIVGVVARGLGQVDGFALRDGKPFAGAMVVLVPQDPANNTPLFRRDQSDSDGSFTLPSVIPGRYTVIAIANGWDLEWGNPAVLQPYLQLGENVQVTGDSKLQVKVEVH